MLVGGMVDVVMEAPLIVTTLVPKLTGALLVTAREPEIVNALVKDALLFCVSVPEFVIPVADNAPPMLPVPVIAKVVPETLIRFVYSCSRYLIVRT